MADEPLPRVWFKATPEVDYYAALNVSRSATADEVRKAFFALSREFHPDKTKHTDEANQEYPRLDRAYKVLSSAPLRLAYDNYGERGVLALEEDKTADWTLGTYVAKDADVEERVRILLRRWNEKHIQAQFLSHTDCEVSIDATDFVRFPLFSLRQIFNKDHRMLSISQMVMRQSTNIQVSPHTTVVLGGYLYDKDGLGLGALTCGINYVTADPAALRIYLSSEMGWTPKLSVHLEQPMSSTTSCFLMPELTTDGLDMTVGVHHALRLSPTLPLQASMLFSIHDGLKSSLQYQDESMEAGTSLAIQNDGPHLGVNLKKQVTSHTSAKVGVDASLGNVGMVLTTTSQVSRRSRVSIALRLALQGINLRFGLARGNVRFAIPIAIAPLSAATAWNTFFAATLPFVLSAVVRQVLRPAQKRKQQRQVQSEHARRISYLMEARRCALAQQTLMARTATKEATEHGIEILVARYGKHPTTAQDGLPSSIEDVNIDVTIPLRFFLQDGCLHLQATSKAGLLGFYDPCIGLYDPQVPTNGPQLYIRYAYDGNVYEATFLDTQEVVLPSVHAQPMGPVGHVL
ncbi:hypothetical protein SDRG_04078 [Saprolegnia diclina VS20]|uniref:J domain-containing protein n=1 Tax=Saprolegnia diclina (strain VS20) TaxID=1156394 RepID=T0QK17_SAPDV|nr:hypothetical protein SDRG_04078 [Saprolegnia diclina VS20]EQC38364.1 hypothetical protein SDRG_04078 [Saprolegnia diclina VS20]|eukprot:XP_008607956.1 hypothetical protein SDRG_04078 [Saprolegnia diclina VS20]